MKFKENILLYTIIYILAFIILKLILSLFKLEFLQWIYILSTIIIAIGTIVGTYQLGKKHKIISVILIIIEILVFLAIGFLMSVCMEEETIVYKDGEKLVERRHSILLSNYINYYDYKNIFVRGSVKKIYEAYDDTLSDEDYLYSYYYDNDGNLIKEEEKTSQITEIDLKQVETLLNSLEKNGFVVASNIYTNIDEINLEEVFYTGAGLNNDITNEELEKYKDITTYHGTDIIKVTVAQAEGIFYNNTGEIIENLPERLKNWTYIQEYDAYYKEVSDTHFETVACMSYESMGNNTFSIKLDNGRTVTIKIKNEKYYFISNI